MLVELANSNSSHTRPWTTRHTHFSSKRYKDAIAARPSQAGLGSSGRCLLCHSGWLLRRDREIERAQDGKGSALSWQAPFHVIFAFRSASW